MPRSRHARITRTAISPRFAISTRSITLETLDRPSPRRTGIIPDARLPIAVPHDADRTGHTPESDVPPPPVRFGILTMQHPPWERLVERWQNYERLGFDGLWVCDHFTAAKDDAPLF